MSKFKRYSEYKESGVEWIGEIPSHWIMTKGKYIWKREKREVHPDDDIVTAFRDGEVTLRKNRREDGFTTALLEHGYQGIRKGDLVIHGMDAFAGAIGVSDSDGKATPVYSACTPVVEANAFYYKYLLQSMSRTGYIEALARGIRERSTEFKYGQFSSLEYPEPPIAEQNIIADFIDRETAKIDTFISNKKKLIELLKEQKTAIINKAVTKGLNPDAPMKDSGIEWLGEIPAHWEVKKLKYLANKVGSGVTPSGGATVYKTEGIPLLRSQNIHFDRIDLNDVAFITEAVHNGMSNSKVKSGDVLLNITGGSLGRCCFVDETLGEANVNQHVCIVRPNKEIHSEFLNLILSSEVGQHQIWFFQQGGGREGLNFFNLKNFFFPVPEFTEQLKILKGSKVKLTKIDTAISQAEKEITLIQEYRQSLITNAVTGKIDVREVV